MTVAQAREAVLQEIGQWSIYVAKTGDLAPTCLLTALLDALIAAVRAECRAQRTQVSKNAVEWLKYIAEEGDGDWDYIANASGSEERQWASELLRALTPAPPDTAVIERLMHDGFKHGKTVREIAESIAAAELLRFVEGQ